MTSSMTISSTTTNNRKYSTSEKLFCAECSELISGKAMKAGSKFWHDYHFICCDCGIRLKDTKVYQKDGRLYCDTDYKRKFVPRCAYCAGFILQDCVRALNQTWHPDHFTCQKCDAPFGEGQGFHEKDGNPYCKKCYVDLVCEKCAGCRLPITDRAMKALDKDWHVHCFVCKTCGCSFEGQKNFYCVNGEPVCSVCVGSESS